MISGTNGTGSLRVRVRTRQACDSCRERKRKCDGHLPCAECRGYGYPCKFSPQVRSRKRHRSTEPETVLSTSPPGPSDQNKRVEHELPNGTPKEPTRPSEGLEEPDTAEKPLLEPYKSRFVRADSACAFANIVGMELGMSKPPRLHSYAWNAGLRPETFPSISGKICQYITFEDASKFFDVFFSVVAPLYGVFERDRFLQRCWNHWQSEDTTIDFEAVVCGAFALGSFFSNTLPSPFESELVEHARLILDSGITRAPAKSSLDQVVAWTLRAIYLRLTTRPHLSWMATCTSLHLAEAIGLHQEIDGMQIRPTLDPNTSNLIQQDAETRRRAFWVSWSLNRLFADDYGRSKVQICNIRCNPVTSRGAQDLVPELIALAQLLPDEMPRELNVAVTQHYNAIRKLELIPGKSFCLQLMKAEVSLMLFRKLRLLQVRMHGSPLGSVLKVCQESLDAARILCTEGQFWWHVLSMPFQYICALISIDNHDGISRLSSAIDVLTEICGIIDTPFAREALQCAKCLVHHMLEKKRNDIRVLEELDKSYTPISFQNESPGLINMVDELMDGNITWENMFDNSAFAF